MILNAIALSRVCVIFLHPYIVYALSAARVYGREITNHSVWQENHLPNMQKRENTPFLLWAIDTRYQDKADAPP